MYYTDEGVSNYYAMYKQAKEFERMRKAKKKKAEKRKQKLAREQERLKKKQERLDRIKREREERKQRKQDLLVELKQVGYKPNYTKKNPLKRKTNSRNIDLCKEIYLKAKSGQSTFSLAKEYDLHPNTILRHKYEYEYILGIKGLDKEIDL